MYDELAADNTHTWKTATHGLVLQGRLTNTKRIILGLGRNRRGCGEMVRAPAVTAAAATAFVIVSFMKTLLGGLRGEREIGDVGGGRSAGHDCRKRLSPVVIQVVVKAVVRIMGDSEQDNADGSKGEDGR